MRTYISQLEDIITLNREFGNISVDIRGMLPQQHGNTCRTCYALNYPIESFLHMFHHLERLLFKDLETVPTRTATYGSRDYPNLELQIERIISNEDTYKSGFLIIQAPKTGYRESESYKHLTAAEIALKINPHHFLKIFTVKDNILVVCTNKPLDFERILKLKLLQWSISKEIIENPIPEILDLPHKLLEKDIDAINRIFNTVFSNEMFQKIQFEKLKNVFKPKFKKRIRMLKGDINSKQNDVDYYESNLLQMIKQLNELKNELETLMIQAEQEPETDTALLKYLTKHPYIKNIDAGEEQIDLCYDAPIIYFDKYLAENMLRTYTDKKAAILRAFIDNKYELMTSCKLTFHTDTFSVGRHRNTPGKTYFGHPHIDAYGCFGNHEDLVHDAAKTMNYLGALEQISQGVLNLNFSDGIVLREMLRNLTASPRYETLRTWRSKETGVLLTTQEIVEIYHEKTETNGNGIQGDA